MIHELKKIILAHQADSMPSVLATVVALDGSSYRRPGVRMLIKEQGKMTGAVSGGCVEKEILRQAKDVFNTGLPKVMVYDGRYRLGCEGILYILIEPFDPDPDFLQGFWDGWEKRHHIQVETHYRKEPGNSAHYGSVVQIMGKSYNLRPDWQPDATTSRFSQELSPSLKLMILGAEHDAVQLTAYAALTGWDVIIVAPPSEDKDITGFPGASELMPVEPESLDVSGIDEYTVIMLMTHSFVKDLGFLMALWNTRPAYIGLLGPSSRRDRLLHELVERVPEVDSDFLDCIHGPAGLDLGAESPQEIAVSVMAEVLAVIRERPAQPLKDKTGRIHS